MEMLTWVHRELQSRVRPREEDGAIGWLALGIIIGVLLVIFGIVKFLIPGD
ncbi:MAG: hypothetical protein M3134_00470 [Actinomycetota bacterium]|nr:hypothetical protein [Actinomycetota bacterium]